MTDVIHNIAATDLWANAASQTSQLFKSQLAPSGAPILLIVSAALAHDTVLAAAAAQDFSVVKMPALSTQEGVKLAIAHTQPCAVVCAPEIFGWVSKLAFLGGCAAIYTCGDEGEGTLLDRASHFPVMPFDMPALKVACKVLSLNAMGVPLAEAG